MGVTTLLWVRWNFMAYSPNLLKISIITDRLQNYDRYLVDRDPDYLWYRDSNDRLMDRAAAFTIFDRIGLQPPPHTWISIPTKEEAIDLNRLHPTIVYLDPCVHAGAGKIYIHPGTMPAFLGRLGWGDKLLCSQFRATSTTPTAISYTYLRVADREYWLESTGGDWRSNYAPDSKWRQIDCPDWLSDAAAILVKRTKLRFYPVMSIDFIRDLEGNVYAIDLNTAPVIESYGLQLDPESTARLLLNYITDNLDLTPDYCIKALAVPVGGQILNTPKGLMHIPFGVVLTCLETGERFQHVENPDIPALAFRCLSVPPGKSIEVGDRLELEIPIRLSHGEFKTSPIAKVGELVEFADLFTQREGVDRGLINARTWNF